MRYCQQHPHAWVVLAHWQAQPSVQLPLTLWCRLTPTGPGKEGSVADALICSTTCCAAVVHFREHTHSRTAQSASRGHSHLKMLDSQQGLRAHVKASSGLEYFRQH